MKSYHVGDINIEVLLRLGGFGAFLCCGCDWNL